MPDLPGTMQRVKEQTPDAINREIQKNIQANINYFRGRDQAEIEQRIEELNQEWDTERVLEANASTLVIVGSILAATVNKKWNILTGVVGSFLLQHAIQGWCPPLPLIRRLGTRTVSEINQEKEALQKMLKS